MPSQAEQYYKSHLRNSLEAIEAYQKEIATEENVSVFAFMGLGNYYVKQNNLDEAILFYSKAVAHPDHSNIPLSSIYYTLASCYALSKNLDQTIEQCSLAIDSALKQNLNWNASSYLANRGIYQFRAGRFEEAINDIKQAIALCPNLDRNYHYLIIILCKTGQYDLATQELENISKTFLRSEFRGATKYLKQSYSDDINHLIKNLKNYIEQSIAHNQKETALSNQLMLRFSVNRNQAKSLIEIQQNLGILFWIYQISQQLTTKKGFLNNFSTKKSPTLPVDLILKITSFILNISDADIQKVLTIHDDQTKRKGSIMNTVKSKINFLLFNQVGSKEEEQYKKTAEFYRLTFK